MNEAPRAGRAPGSGAARAAGDLSEARARRFELGALALLLGLFAASRLGVAALGISPDPTALDGLWQNLPIDALMADYWGALAGLRSQPPLWNALLGAAAQVCGGDLVCIAGVFQWSFMALSLVAALALRAALGRVGTRPALAWGAAYLLALSPSAMFFELFPLYPQVTLALGALIGLALASIRAGAGLGAGLGAVAGLYAAMTALCLTWSLFHPAFLPLAGVAAWLAGSRAALRPAGLALLLGFTLAASVPAIRNQADYGLMAGGTWGGLNLAQTVATFDPETRARCSFAAVIAEVGADQPELRAKALHLPATARISRDCLDQAVAAIFADPLPWLQGRAGAVLSSHRLWPYEYVQYQPLGWERMPIPDAAQAQDPGTWRMSMRTALLGGWLTFAWYAAIAWGAAWALGRDGFGAARGVALGLGLLIVGEEAMAHLFNGIEQARMRWTVEPLILMLAAMSLEAWLRGRRDGRST